MALFTNNAFSTLAAPIDGVATSITVQTGDGSKFPTPSGGTYFFVTLTQGSGPETSWEIVKCTARTGDVLTVTRAQEGTSAASWVATSKVQLRLTAAGLGDKQDFITAGATSQYWRGDKTWQTLPTGGDASTNTATSVDSEIAVFSGTGGKTLKRATGSGIAKLTSGVLGTATSGTDYAKPDTAASWSAPQTYTSSITETPAVANTSTAYTITDRTTHVLTLTGNCTFTFPTAAAGKQFTLLLTQDATGSRTVTWPSSVRWSGGTVPTITATASKTDVISFFCDGTYWLGFVGGFNYTRA